MYKLPGAVPEKFLFGETIKMKKTLLVTSLATAMGVAATVDAAFTAMGDGDYKMVITSGCFFFGDCVVGDATAGDYTDNTNITDAIYGWSGNNFAPGGSGIINDGLMGVIDFTLTGGNITVTSFSQDSYLNTAGGTFYLSGNGGIANMGGTIDAAGNMSFNPTGRLGLAASVGSTELLWNLNDSTNVFDDQGTGLVVSNVYDQWTTGTTTALCKIGTSCVDRNGNFIGVTKTGSILTENTDGTWGGTLAVASNVGDDWGLGFTGIAYSEEFNVTITCTDPSGCPTTVIPVPAAVWLFGSGLLGLVGVARRKKQA